MHEKNYLKPIIVPPSKTGILLDELRIDLPKKLELPTELKKIINSPEDSQRIFQSSLDYWKDTYDKENILSIISIVAEIKDRQKLLEVKQLLKKIRKPGNILLSIFLMLDKDHFAPEKHWKVTMNMGKFRDYAGTSVKKYEKRLIDAINDYSLEETAKEFQPDSQKGFEEFISNTIDHMQNIVLEASYDDVRALHMLRKNGTRLLMNLFQMSYLTNQQPDHYQMFAYFRMLDKKLGDAHDVAEKQRIKQAGSYDGVQMIVSEEIKKQIIDVINFIGQQWQLDFDKTMEIKPDLFSEDYNKYL